MIIIKINFNYIKKFVRKIIRNFKRKFSKFKSNFSKFINKKLHKCKHHKKTNSKILNNKSFIHKIIILFILFQIMNFYFIVKFIDLNNSKINNELTFIQNKLDNFEQIIYNLSTSPVDDNEIKKENNNSKFKKETDDFNSLKGKDKKKFKIITDYILSVNSKVPIEEVKLIAKCLIDAGNEFGINPYILTGIAKTESTFNKFSVSNKNAVGLMQVHWPSHKTTLPKAFAGIQTRNDLFDIKNAIYAGAWLYKCALTSYNGDHLKAMNRYFGANSSIYRSKILKVKNILESM